MIKIRGRGWKKISATGALAIAPGPRRHIRQYFRLSPSAVDGPACAEYLTHLLRRVRGPIDLVWDRLSAHRSPEAAAVLRRSPRVRVHWLPTYAPELNPVEQMWSNAKAAKLRGVAADDEIDLSLDAQLTLDEIGEDQHLLRSFVRNTPLRIPGISS